MDIQSYISSGILEAYALGALTDQERAQVEANVTQYPEVADELRAIEDSMVQFAEQDAQQPPAHLKEQIWSALQQKEEETVKIEHNETRSATIETPRTIPLGKTVPKFNLQRAAIWVLLIGSVAMNMVLFNRTNQMRDGNQVAAAQMDSLKSEKDRLTQITDNYRKQAEMMSDSAMQTIVMQSALKGHAMVATVFTNKINGATYLSVQNMPVPPQGMQYQLWIIKDGKPVSMGVVPNTMVTDQGLQKINMQITGGQAYAISLEKEGGNPTPTTVYVVGKVS